MKLLKDIPALAFAIGSASSLAACDEGAMHEQYVADHREATRRALQKLGVAAEGPVTDGVIVKCDLYPGTDFVDADAEIDLVCRIVDCELRGAIPDTWEAAQASFFAATTLGSSSGGEHSLGRIDEPQTILCVKVPGVGN